MTRENSIISSQIINTLETSNAPWGIKDKFSHFLYGNDALAKLQNINSTYDYRGKNDSKTTLQHHELYGYFIKHANLSLSKNGKSFSFSYKNTTEIKSINYLTSLTKS
ncbi:MULTISPECIES: hypothetical protein [Photorhabdus]|uniref:Similarities with luxr family transcriptional regulator n=1 Tax=Photorhabdus asymbiotica subsp. asymbiotica (strain ATCC 43949 / 3105-77) TaxID=553480 RepID=C7BN80_PHOAA|nr:similarities with luxr family transcriptional regulator [Photorhabdus asymbiotica]